MKLAVAQLRPTAGAVERNTALHLELIDLGVQYGASLIIFPELSLTGYEPSQAASLALSCYDPSFARLQSTCDANNIAVGVGLPLRTDTLPLISHLLFRPQLKPRIYSKRFLHSDERAFFSCGTDNDSTILDDPKVAIAICYELSVPEHSQMAFAMGATAYVASVAKNASGVGEAGDRLSSIAEKHSALALMSNCVGMFDGIACAGGSAVWGRDGSLLAKLDDSSDGVIVVDYNAEKTVTRVLASSTQ